MTDIVDAATRSRMMAGIRGRDTKPEIEVRRFLHGKGLRFRIHAGGLPGRPDLVLPSRRAVVFVHGCFWHQHPGCRFASRPGSNVAFWREKLLTNVARDSRKTRQLKEAGWRVFVVWECNVKLGKLTRLYRALKQIRPIVKS